MPGSQIKICKTKYRRVFEECLLFQFAVIIIVSLTPDRSEPSGPISLLLVLGMLPSPTPPTVYKLYASKAKKRQTKILLKFL